MYVRHHTVTVPLSSMGAGTAYSTTFNGALHSVFTQIGGAVGAGSKITVTGNSTRKIFLNIADPSTLGTYRYPRRLAQGTSGNIMGSSSPCYILFADERARVKVTSSSGLAGKTATVILQVV